MQPEFLTKVKDRQAIIEGACHWTSQKPPAKKKEFKKKRVNFLHILKNPFWQDPVTPAHAKPLSRYVIEGFTEARPLPPEIRALAAFSN